MTHRLKRPGAAGLYDPAWEHDACGIGAVADLRNRRTHDTVAKALWVLDHLEHRGASGAEVDARRPALGARVRAPPLRDPARDRGALRDRRRDPVVLVAHARLQGHAHLAAAAAVLPRPARRAHGHRAGARALALLDQHVPEL